MKSGSARATGRLERDKYAMIIPAFSSAMIVQRRLDAERGGVGDGEMVYPFNPESTPCIKAYERAMPINGSFSLISYSRLTEAV
jgi:hypothetical protein